jgi:hypothetical protein
MAKEATGASAARRKVPKAWARVTAAATLTAAPEELQQLRNFFLDCSEILKSEGNLSFFKKWLNNQGPLHDRIGYWNPFRLEELHADMLALQPPK